MNLQRIGSLELVVEEHASGPRRVVVIAQEWKSEVTPSRNVITSPSSVPQTGRTMLSFIYMLLLMNHARNRTIDDQLGDSATGNLPTYFPANNELSVTMTFIGEKKAFQL